MLFGTAPRKVPGSYQALSRDRLLYYLSWPDSCLRNAVRDSQVVFQVIRGSSPDFHDHL